MLSDKEKLDFLESNNIPFVKTKLYTLEVLYKLARTKDLVKSRLDKELDCYGTVDENVKECKDCVLNGNGTCKLMKDYLHYLENTEDLVSISDRMGELQDMTTDSIKDTLEKINFRPDSVSFQIAKIILEGHNKSMTDILVAIMACCPERDVIYARTRFYQIKKKLEEATDLQIETVTQKFLHISKKI